MFQSFQRADEGVQFGRMGKHLAISSAASRLREGCLTTDSVFQRIFFPLDLTMCLDCPKKEFSKCLKI